MKLVLLLDSPLLKFENEYFFGDECYYYSTLSSKYVFEDILVLTRIREVHSKPNSFYFDKSIEIIELSDYNRKSLYAFQLLWITIKLLRQSDIYLYTDGPFGFLFKVFSFFSNKKLALITEVRSYVLLNKAYLEMRFGKIKGHFIGYIYKKILSLSFHFSNYIILIHDFPEKGFNTEHRNKVIMTSDSYIDDEFYFNSEKSYNRIKNFLFVGNLVFGKRVEWVIKTFNLICQEISDAHLRIIGDGPLLEETVKLVQVMGLSKNVIFEGRITDKKVIRNFLINSDLLLSTSVSETGPRVIAEAASTKLLFFSTDTGSILKHMDERCTSNSDDVNLFYWDLKNFISLSPLIFNEISLNNYQASKKYNKNKLFHERVEIWKTFTK